ncbi:NAC domain-containing protein 35-like [Miscanthus floridulus]|uniref:NAC domain-containing protein 35-like n=1 Tax=Miscanthus floridulus TaxID=154761 RepID=UPI003457EDBA
MSPAAAAVFYTQPTDIALVKEFLQPWIVSSEIDRSGVGEYIHAEDMYSAAPEELTAMFAPVVSHEGNRAWYFLSPVRPKSTKPGGQKKSRTAGGGCWHGEGRKYQSNRKKHIVDFLEANWLITKHENFTIKLNGVPTGWIMSEYSLDAEVLPELAQDIALCKVYRSPCYRDTEAVPANTARHHDAVVPEGARHHVPMPEASFTMEAASSRKRKTAASSVATPTKKAHAIVVTSMPPPALKNRAVSEDHDEQSQSVFVDTKGAVFEDHNEQSQHAFIDTKDMLARTKKPVVEEGAAEASTVVDLH